MSNATLEGLEEKEREGRPQGRVCDGRPREYYGRAKAVHLEPYCSPATGQTATAFLDSLATAADYVLTDRAHLRKDDCKGHAPSRPRMARYRPSHGSESTEDLRHWH
jgi:hypothetical protein